MVMQVDVSPEDMEVMKTVVNENDMRAFISESVSKAIHNAAYESKLKQGFKEIEEGRVVTYTEEEWEKFGRELGHNFMQRSL